MNLPKINKFFAPAPHVARLPEDQVKKRYPRYRWRILESTFIGYALFYLVRNNVPVVADQMGQAFQYTLCDDWYHHGGDRVILWDR